MVKLLSLKEHGLVHCMTSVKEWQGMDQARRERLTEFIQTNGLGVTLGIYCDYFGDRVAAREDLARQTDAFLELAPQVNALIGHTGVASTHRFAADPNLNTQMEALADLLPPVARQLEASGRPLAIENHGDYYVSDLVELCGKVPGLRIFLDTGNTFLVGEKPIPAFREAAPLVVGGHFKDHVVRPNPSPLQFEIGAATLGTGHVPLRECFAILKEHTPNFEKTAMQIELIPPSFAGEDNIRSFEESVAFVMGLEAGA